MRVHELSWLTRGNMATGLLIIGLVAANASLAPVAFAQRQSEKSADVLRNSPKVIAAFRDVVAKPSQSTVRVLCEGKETALGTVVGADGWILTKASELKGTPICKLKDDREFEAKVVGIHEPNDLAMLKIEAKNLHPVSWTDSKNAAVGNWVASTGLGEEPVAIGVVSVASRTLPAGGRQPRPAPGANSGYLGVMLQPSEDGAKISEIVPKSPADKAGLKVNDVVLAVEGKKILDTESLVNVIQSYKPGDTIAVKLLRNEQQMELKATLDKRPAGSGRSDFQNRMGSSLSERRQGFATFLQHDTVLKPSDCGGPIVDLDGKAIGVNIARAGRTESYALPSELVVSLLPQLKSGKLAPKVPSAKLTAAAAAVQQAEADRQSAEKNLAKARADLKKDEEAIRAAEKKVADAKVALMKAEEASRGADKKAAEAKAALEKVESEEKAKDAKSDSKP